MLMVSCTGAQSAPSTEEAAAEAIAEPEQTPTIEPSLTPRPTPTITPAPDYNDISTLPRFVGKTPEETFERYIQDAVLQQVSIQREKVDMRMRYQNPNILNQELETLIIDIDLLEDRSLRTVLRETSATFEVEIDVRVAFADGDTSTLTCAWTTTLRKSGDEWYVETPRELLLFINCA